MDRAGAVLRERFGLQELRPIQREIVERALAGGDAMVVLPTGSGKSLCYQLPALVRRERAGAEAAGVGLVLSPLIALMEDQVSALRKRGIRAEYINSTLDKAERRRRCERLGQGAYELIYATPERMDKPEFAEALARVPGGVVLLAVDECHCVSKWGHDLRPAYRRVGRFREQLGQPPTLALTATATPAVREDVRAVLGATEASMPLFAGPIDRPNLTLRAQEVWDDADKVRALAALAGRNPGTGIVYGTLIKDLERLEPLLRRAMGGREVLLYHGRLDPREKKRVYRRFIDAAPADGLVLLATNAFGMGVDKPDVRFIAHAQMPASVEAYHQEVGRSGRDGLPSECLLLFCQDDLAIQQEFIRWQNPTADLLVQVASAIEARFATDDFDADDLRLAVIGKGHAHGQGGGVVEYALIALAEAGVLEAAHLPGEGARYRLVRALDDAEIDPAEIDAKHKRDLLRLLDVVKMARSGDIPAFVSAYFGLS
jgi:ATP-dependent DNA helicase RecQ